MTVLGIESSCDECSVALVDDGRHLLAQTIHTQIEFHKKYMGVVPEIASRKHTEWIQPVYRETLAKAGMTAADVDGIAVTRRPGLTGSLVVGLSFAKALSATLEVPFVGVDHILSHLYAVQLEQAVDYPFLALLVSGGHTLIGVSRSPLELEVLGATIDDACGEAFDKVAKHYGFGYPGGVVIDGLARRGDPRAARFPDAELKKGKHEFDVSYSGLKTAAINQLDKFWNDDYPRSPENIAAAFQRAAIDMVLKRLNRAISATGITKVVVAGGVAANSYLREALETRSELDVYLPSLELCTDNAAMVAGLGYHVIGERGADPYDIGVFARTPGFKRGYP
jgi:N6-L-threonylcarbamoyladenine synthase